MVEKRMLKNRISDCKIIGVRQIWTICPALSIKPGQGTKGTNALKPQKQGNKPAEAHYVFGITSFL